MQKLALVFLLAFACGEPRDPEVSYEPKPTQGPPAPAALDFAADIKPLIDANCGKCHNGTKEPAFDTADKFKASKAKARLGAGTMPPAPATISAADKQKLLAFLGS